MPTELIADKRNILDKYKGWEQELIKDDLKKNCFPYAVMMAQLVGDYNFGSIVRTANAFGAEKVFYYGKKRFDRRGMKGVQHYSTIHFLETFELIKELKKEYLFIGVEQANNSVKLKDFVWPKEKCLIILGEEGKGLTQDILDLCNYIVEIPIFGSIRSLNVGVAGGLVINDLLTKNYV